MMLTRSLLRRCFGLLVSLACLAAPAFAQKDSLADRLPPETMLVFDWHGTASLAAMQKTNPMLRFWSDPLFATVREQWMREAYAGSKPDSSGTKLTYEQFKQFISLFENRFAAGVIGEDFTATEAGKKPHMFLLFDTTGKQEILQMVLKQRDADQKATHEASAVVGRVKVEKIVETKQTYYEAMVGSMFLHTDSMEVMQSLVPRFGAAELPATSLSHSKAYEEARGQALAGTLAEFYLRMPDLKKLQLPPNPKFDFTAFASAIHLEQLHSLDASLSFTADATRMHAAILGNTAPGGILDVFGDNSGTFATLALAANGSAYGGGKLNLLSLYQLIRKGLLAAIPPSDASQVAQIDAMAVLGLGMPLDEALQLFTGEFAQIQEVLSSDPSTGLYALTIRDQQKTLNLLRHVLASMLSTEDSQGDTTFLEIAVPYADPKTGTQRRRFYAVAVTPTLLLAGPRKSALRQAIARTSGGATTQAPGRLMDDASFARTRATLPAKLTSLGYSDFSHAPWDKIVGGWVDKAEEAAQRSGKPVDPSLEVLRKIAPSVLSNYLHVWFSGSWKEPNGVYFDLFMQ